MAADLVRQGRQRPPLLRLGVPAPGPPRPCAWRTGRPALAHDPPQPQDRRAGLLPLLHAPPHPACRPGPGRRAALDGGDLSTTVHSYVRTGCMIFGSIVVGRLGVGPASAGVPARWAGPALAELGEFTAVGVEDPAVRVAGFLAGVDPAAADPGVQ